MDFSITSFASSSLNQWAVSSVKIRPGETVLANIPCPENSFANPLESMLIPAFAIS